MSTNWLSYFTDALRRNPNFGSGYWGSLEMGTNISVGDCGYIDSSGTYHHVATLSELGQHLGSPPNWQPQVSASFQDSSVQSQTAALGGDAEFIDPETGTIVKGGMSATWSFAESGQMAAVFPAPFWQGYEPTDVLGVLELVEVLQQLIAWANPVGYTNAEGYLTKGFVVVYGVLAVVAGSVVGANSKNASFEIQGSMTGIDAMLSGSANAAYGYTTGYKGEFGCIWPPSELTSLDQLQGPNRMSYVADPSNKRTIGFKVFSFDGSDAPIQDWAG